MRLILAVLAAALPSPCLAALSAEDVKTFTLDNGMKFLVLEDRSIPSANLYLFWKVGSRNEAPGITGLSHFFEHMMFNGAKKYGPKEFDRVMEDHGGSNNAWTSEDLTVYTDWFPSPALEVVFELEADRIAHLGFDPETIESERGVVLSEWLTSRENSPWTLLDDQVKALAFTAHPYRWPVLGVESDIRAWTRDDLIRYFRTYYAPNNCVAVVAGDVNLDRVKALAEKHFGPIPAGALPPTVRTREPEPRGERRARIEKDVPAPVLMMSWIAPEARHEDAFAVRVLDALLSDGRSARLTRAVVEREPLALEASSFYSMTLDPGLFQIYAVCSEAGGAAALEAAILREIRLLAGEGPTARELNKVSNRFNADLYRDLESINGKAHWLGSAEVFLGGFEKLFEMPAKIGAVTADDVKRAAARVLAPARRSVAVLESPKGE